VGGHRPPAITCQRFGSRLWLLCDSYSTAVFRITNFPLSNDGFIFLVMSMLEVWGSWDLNLGNVAREQDLHDPIDSYSDFTA